MLKLDREIFSRLVEPIWQIYQNYQTGMVPMRRGDIDDMRKILFLTTSLRNRDRNQHLLARDPNMEAARNRRKKFMEMHTLDHPRDLWLQNAELILDNYHFNIATDPDIFDLDRDDYQANARERFIVFWEAGPGEEFVLTENAFGCFEGCGLGARKKLTVELTAREHEVRTYTRDFMWHQIYVLSPKLVLALCHGTLLHPVLTKAQRRRWGLRRSLLEDLPHPLANNYYKDMTRGEIAFLKPGWEVPPEVEKLFGQPRWDGKVIAIENRAQDELVFPVSTLSSQQVSRVNCVLLQNQTSSASKVQSVSFRPPSSYRSLHESLVKFTEVNWSKYTDEKQNTYEGLEKRLSQYLNKIEDVRSNGSAPIIRPPVGIFTPPLMTPDPSTDGRGVSAKKAEKPSKPETIMTVLSEVKKERRKSTVAEFHRFEQGILTPPQTQPQSRESSLPPPVSAPSIIPNLRIPSSSMPPPSDKCRAPSTERSMSQLTEKPTPYRPRAPSSDRTNTNGSVAATTCEVPTRRATVSSQAAPQLPLQEERRAASRDRRFSINDRTRVEPLLPVAQVPDVIHEQPVRGGVSSLQPPPQPQQAPEQKNTPPLPSQRQPSAERKFSSTQQQDVSPVSLVTPTHESRRSPSTERRYSVAPQPRADSLPRPQPAENRQSAPGTQVPPTQHQQSSIPVPEPKASEGKFVASEKAGSRQSSQPPAIHTPPSQPPPQAAQAKDRVENPKLTPELLEHIEKQRRIEQQRAEQVKAEQERATKERAERERQQQQERMNREREQERLNQQRAQQRAEWERLEQERVKAEQLRAEQERQKIEQDRLLEQVRAGQQQRAALEQQRKDAYNRPRERSTSAHSPNNLVEAIWVDKARFENFECQTPSEMSNDSSGSSGSGGSSGSSGSGSGPSSRDSDNTERPVKIRGGSVSPGRRAVLLSQTQFLQPSYDDDESVCDGAESMIVEPDEDNEELWDDENAEISQRQLQVFSSKPRKQIVRFASPKPTQMSGSHSPGARKATNMGANNKGKYASHVQHAQHPIHINQPHHNVYPAPRNY